MPLAVGARLGPYEVVAPIGAGGMGEVYRAHDTKLHRDVALKVLPDSFARDPERLARFEREAHVLASLNHPNIAHVHGFEESSGVRALVMEFVDGRDLSHVIRESRRAARGLELEDAIRIARQIADALETAHEAGIVHRDLKPANIKVRDDGTVKVLDFGLAKAIQGDGSHLREQDGSPSLATMTSPAMTQLGMILGTAAYMSPEQARGRAVDRRADIWAFGVVLYEMLTGERPFAGSDVTETLASVIKEDVNWQRLPADVPPAIRRLLRRSLEKDPKRRLSAIADARLELDEASAGVVDPASGTAVQVPRRRDWILPAALGAVALIAVGVAGWTMFRPPPEAPPVVRFSMTTPVASMDADTTPRISPDGRLVGFIGFVPKTTTDAIWLRPTNSVEAAPLAGTDGATGLVWSPDSRSMAFVAHDKLQRIETAGGSPRFICKLSGLGVDGAAWGRGGVILLASSSGRLVRVADTGGELEDVLPPAQGRNYGFPGFLPDGRHFSYFQWGADAAARGTYVATIDGGAPARLMETPALYASGFVLVSKGDRLVAQPFDAASLRLSGQPVQLDVPDDAEFSVSDNGVLVYRTEQGGSSLADLVWVDRAGKSLGVVGDGRRYYQLRIAPDERRVAVQEGFAARSALSILDLSTQVASPVAVDLDVADDPIWSEDGGRLAFESDASGTRNFFQVHPGDIRTTPIFESAGPPKFLDDWSHDGRYILFHQGEIFGAQFSLLALPLFGDRRPIQLSQSKTAPDEAHFSPDDKWVAYQVADSGRSEIWVAAFPAFDHRQQISGQGGCEPWWRGDGKELFYLSLDGQIMSVPVGLDPGTGSLVFRAATALFQSPIRRPALVIDEYGVTRDGNRFLFIQPRDQMAGPPPVTVVVNWTSGLKR